MRELEWVVPGPHGAIWEDRQDQLLCHLSPGPETSHLELLSEMAQQSPFGKRILDSRSWLSGT